MKRLYLTALTLVSALVACAGSGTEPTPTPPVTVASIAYTTDAALLFTGKAVPVRALVRGYDAAGIEVPSSALALTLPAGWMLKGDSIVAPGTEAVGTLRASGKAALTVGASASLSAVAADSTTVTAAIDLRAFGWTASWSCGQKATSKSIISEKAVPVDSMRFVGMAVDSVSYPADSGFVRNFGGIAQLWWHGRAVQYLRDGGRDTVAVGTAVVVTRQSPDTIFFSPATGEAPLPTVRKSPGVYTGGSWCSAGWDAFRGPVTFTGSKKP